MADNLKITVNAAGNFINAGDLAILLQNVQSKLTTKEQYDTFFANLLIQLKNIHDLTAPEPTEK
jgi:hypothetical protein